MEVAQDGAQWWALVPAVLSLQVVLRSTMRACIFVNICKPFTTNQGLAVCTAHQGCRSPNKRRNILYLCLLIRFANCAGVSEPRPDREGFPLPNPRVVSAHVHRDEGPHDHAVSLMFAVWGQLMDHDLTFTAETKGRLAGLIWTDSS